VIVSGALYLVVLSCEVVTFATNSYLFNVFLDMVSPTLLFLSVF
jgi:hypothetical protein